MKVLIYVACFIVLVIIQTIFIHNRIVLGAIPSVLLWCLTWWGARALCKVWDNRIIRKNQQKKSQK